jgi:hypothetical protein
MNCAAVWKTVKQGKGAMTKDKERLRAGKLEKKCERLHEIIDSIWMEICPEKEGTWQERARYALETAQKIGLKNRKKKRKSLKTFERV